MECKHKILLKSGLIVPCGRCPQCLANQRQEWVFRLRVEQERSLFSLFVTFTYDDEHLPDDYSVNKRDVQLFLKRLRKRIGSFRYYLISEYGDHTFRPHYHGLFFFSNTFKDKKKLYDDFTSAWQNGFCKFGQVEEGSIVYCTKYCLKKSKQIPGQKALFRLCSKMNGGLGYDYLAKMAKWHLNSQNYDFVSWHGVTCRMPKYYKDKMFIVEKELNPLFVEQRKELIVERSYSKHMDKFKEFIAERHYSTFLEAQEAFNKEMQRRSDAEAKLISKHTKKQNSF